ncbi:MAG: hypothetical protein ABSB42_18710 [Tepidisphaeraceae bacterium]
MNTEGEGRIDAVRARAPRCPNCNYLLLMLQSDRCPECGAAVARPEVPATAGAAPNLGTSTEEPSPQPSP